MLENLPEHPPMSVRWTNWLGQSSLLRFVGLEALQETLQAIADPSVKILPEHDHLCSPPDNHVWVGGLRFDPKCDDERTRRLKPIVDRLEKSADDEAKGRHSGRRLASCTQLRTLPRQVGAKLGNQVITYSYISWMTDAVEIRRNHVY